MSGAGRVQLRRSPDPRRGAQLLHGDRTGARHRGRRRQQRSADPRFPGELPRAAQHRRHARRPAPGGRPRSRVLCASTSAGLAPGRWTNRTSRCGRQPRRDGADRGRPLQALARPADSEARARQYVDTAHDAFIGIDAAEPHRQLERTRARRPSAGLATRRSDATWRPWSYLPPIARPASAASSASSPAGEAPVVNRRLELTALHRAGHELPIEIAVASPMPLGRGASLRRVPRGHLRAAGAGGAAAHRQGVG